MPSTDPTMGWPVPDDTDPLADGAAAIRALAASVAASVDSMGQVAVLGVAAAQTITRSNGLGLVNFSSGISGTSWLAPADGVYLLSGELNFPWFANQDLNGGNGHFSYGFGVNGSNAPAGDDAFGSTHGDNEQHSLSYTLPSAAVALTAGAEVTLRLSAMSQNGHSIAINRGWMQIVRLTP